MVSVGTNPTSAVVIAELEKKAFLIDNNTNLSCKFHMENIRVFVNVWI